MLMRTPEYRVCVEQEVQSPHEAVSSRSTSLNRESYSQREMLLGQIVLLLTVVIAILLRSWSI